VDEIWLYHNEWFSFMQMCAVNMWLYAVCVLCYVFIYIYVIQLSDAYLFVVCVLLVCIYLLYTAVFCTHLFECCLIVIHINMTKTYRQHTIKGWQLTAVYNTHKHDKNIQTTYNQGLTVHSCIEYIFLFNNNIFLSKMLVTFLLQKPKLLMKYFILLFYSMEAVFFKRLIECCLSVFVRLICTLCSCVLSTFDCMLSVCLCHVYVYYIQLCVVNLSLYVICMFCQVNMYSMQLWQHTAVYNTHKHDKNIQSKVDSTQLYRVHFFV
jgi:hypothetical protein